MVPDTLPGCEGELHLFPRTWHAIGSIWGHALFGTGIMLVGTGLGWSLARDEARSVVRPVAWWVRRVALPLLRCRSWWRRTATIFLNNTLMLAGVVAMGRWGPAAMLATAALGVSLGVGLRLLCEDSDLEIDQCPKIGKAARRLVAVGVGLNLLEPPAIVLAIGLGLGRQDALLPPDVVWETFAGWVVPLTLVAAAGEALWLGIHHQRSSKTAPDGGPTPDRDDPGSKDDS